MLGWLEPLVTNGGLDAIVIDEAHYVKNPQAQRSHHSAALIAQAEYALLMTGTPLENRVEEFKNLVGYVQPELAARANDTRAHQFRKDVAPAYLRRGQADVPSELPELVEVEEWLPLSPADLDAYAQAVSEGHFHQMRQAVARAEMERLSPANEHLASARTIHNTPRPVHGTRSVSLRNGARPAQLDSSMLTLIASSSRPLNSSAKGPDRWCWST